MNLFVMMECKKIKNCHFGSLCRVLHSAKNPVAECHDHGTRQRIKKKFKLCRVPARGHSAKNFFLKKIQTLPSAGKRALGKDFF